MKKQNKNTPKTYDIKVKFRESKLLVKGVEKYVGTPAMYFCSHCLSDINIDCIVSGDCQECNEAFPYCILTTEKMYCLSEIAHCCYKVVQELQKLEKKIKGGIRCVNL